MVPKGKSRQGHCQVRLSRACRADAESDGIPPDGVHIELLPQRAGTDGIAALGEIDNILFHFLQKLLFSLIHKAHHQPHLPLRQTDTLTHHVAEPLHHMNRLLHRLMVSLHADEISPARYINAVMVSHDLQIRTVSFKNMGRFLLIPDEYFFYPSVIIFLS